MGSWGSTALVGYSREDLPSQTTWSRLLKRNETKYLTRSSIRLKFLKITDMLNPAESGGYINSSGSPKPIQGYQSFY